MTNTEQRRIEWIEGLRGIAALAVVFCHTRGYVKELPTGYIAEALFYPGAMGVDLFFIISGFIMAYTTMNLAGGGKDAAAFLLRRITRVWPSYALASLAVVVLINRGFGYFDSPDNLIAFGKAMLFLPANVKASTVYFGMPLDVAWTLVFEFYFYLIFAATLLFGRFRYLVLAIWLVLTLVAFPYYNERLSLNVFAQYVSFDHPYLNVMVSPLVWEFIAGIVAAMVYTSRIRIESRAVLYNLLFISLGVLLWANTSRLSNIYGPADWGWPLMLVFLALMLLSKTVPLRIPPVMLWLGKISYSLYLTHMIALILVYRVLHEYGGRDYTQSWSHIVLAVTVSIPFAAMWQHFMEAPASRLMKLALQKLKEPRQSGITAPLPSSGLTDSAQ